MTNGARNFLKRMVNLKKVVGHGFRLRTATLCLPELQYCEVYIGTNRALSFMDLDKIQKISGSTYVIPESDSIFIRVN